MHANFVVCHIFFRFNWEILIWLVFSFRADGHVLRMRVL